MGNLEKGIEACRQAKEKGADIAIFPEMWSCGYAFPHDEASLREYAVSCDNVSTSRSREIRFAFLTGTANCSIVIPKSISVILEKKTTKASWMPVMPFLWQTWTQKKG